MNRRTLVAVALVGVLVASAVGFYIAAVPNHGNGSSGSATVPVAVLGQTGHSMLTSGTGQLPAAAAASLSCPVPSSQCFESYNWGGYAISSGSTVTQVSGSWTVPSITGVTGSTCPDPQKEWMANAQWIGIDGFSSSTVEQTGIEAQCFYGHAQYYAWYEMYPAGTVAAKFTVTPGDSISATVTYMGLNATGVPTFKTHLDDLTAGVSFNSPITAVPGAALASAEWIEEAPYYDGILGLTPVSVVKFTAANAVVGGVRETIGGAGTGAYWIALVDYQFPYKGTAYYAKADPSGLNAAGNSFSVTFLATGP